MKLSFRLSVMIFVLSFYNAIYSMNQSAEAPTHVFPHKTRFRNCIIDVTIIDLYQNGGLRESNRITELLSSFLMSLAPEQQNLQYFPLINIVHNKDIYYDTMRADWTPNFKQADFYYKHHYALTNFLRIKPSHATSQALAALTQFASDMNYKNLTISIKPIILQQPINIKFKAQSITENAQSITELEAELTKLKAELAESEAELETRLEKNKLEFHTLKELIFPTPAPIVQIIAAPEPQPISRELANAGWRNMSVAQTPAQILAPKKLPNKPVLTVFSALKPSAAYEALARTLQADRITKLVNATQTPPQSPSANHI